MSITSNVLTYGSKATNELVYGQSDAGRVQIAVWAETAAGLKSEPEFLVLPVIY